MGWDGMGIGTGTGEGMTLPYHRRSNGYPYIDPETWVIRVPIYWTVRGCFKRGLAFKFQAFAIVATVLDGL